MALRYTRGSVKTQANGTDVSSLQASENFVPARETGKQLLVGKLGSSFVPNIGVTTRGGLRVANTGAGVAALVPSGQTAELRSVAGTSYLGLRSKNLPFAKVSDVPLKTVCY